MCLALAAAASVALTACGHKRIVATVPPPPPPPVSTPTARVPANRPPVATTQPAPELTAPDNAVPVYVETGLASWYGPPYHNRRAANGEIYDMNQPTAAHRTLPLGSLVRVTNVATGHSTLVRITDRGPFIEGRILDLSLAAAKAVDVWRPGVARVKMEVLETPAPLDTGGRWCVQIGAFTDVDEATRLKQELVQRYQSAKVLQFAGPTGEWLRVRVAQDDRRSAEQVYHATSTAEGAVFLVRLD